MTAESSARRIDIDALPGPGQHHKKWFAYDGAPLSRRCQPQHTADASIADGR